MSTPAVFDLAFEMTQQRIRTAPGIDIYVLIEEQLDFVRGFGAVGAEPTEADRARVTIGAIAARNFEEVDPAYARVLYTVSALFRGGEGTR